MEVAWAEEDVPQEIADEVEILEGLVDGDEEGLEIGD